MDETKSPCDMTKEEWAAHVDAMIEATPKPKARRGFACMSPEKRTEISRKGGLAMPNEKRAYFKDRELAAASGRKGGENSRGGGRKRMPIE